MTRNVIINTWEETDVAPFCTPNPSSRYAAFVEVMRASMSDPIITCAQCGGIDPNHPAVHYLFVPCQCEHPGNI